MGLNVDLQVLTAPAGAGNQTYALAANFDPKAVILWTSYQTADGVADGDGSFIYGFGTYRGSVVQQWHEGLWYDDGAATDLSVRFRGSGSLLKSTELGDVTTRFEVDLFSMTGGASSEVVLNWVDPPGSLIKVFMLVLGGSEITDAVVGSFTTAVAATQDVALPAGFGRPDLMMFQLGGWTNETTGVEDARMGLGVSKADGLARRAAVWGNDGGGVTMSLGAWQKARALLLLGSLPTVADAEGEIEMAGAADGFRINWPDNPSFGFTMGYLALKGTFTATVNSFTAPTATGDVDIAHPYGVGVKCALLFGTHTRSNFGSLDNFSTRVGGFFIGAYDGTDQGSAGFCNEGGAFDVLAGWAHSQTKILEHLDATAGAPTVVASATASFGGPGLRLNFGTVDSVDAEGSVLLLGDAVPTRFIAGYDRFPKKSPLMPGATRP